MQKNIFIKIGIVLAGYLLALTGAFVAAYLQELATRGTDAQASQGMYAFGEIILFLVVFGVLALLPTALGFYFLRPIEKFWTGFGVLCLAFAVTRPVFALANTLMIMMGGYSSNPWAALLSLAGVLGIFAAPVFAVGFLILAIIAPSTRSRILMLIAAGCEALAAIYVLINFLFSQRFF